MVKNDVYLPKLLQKLKPEHGFFGTLCIPYPSSTLSQLSRFRAVHAMSADDAEAV